MGKSKRNKKRARPTEEREERVNPFESKLPASTSDRPKPSSSTNHFMDRRSTSAHRAEQKFMKNQGRGIIKKNRYQLEEEDGQPFEEGREERIKEQLQALDQSDKKRTHKEIMMDVMQKSKLYKELHRRERDQLEVDRLKLNLAFNKIRGDLLDDWQRPSKKEEEVDVSYNQLFMEIGEGGDWARATDPLLSEAEMVQKQQESIQQGVEEEDGGDGYYYDNVDEDMHTMDDMRAEKVDPTIVAHHAQSIQSITIPKERLEDPHLDVSLPDAVDVWVGRVHDLDVNQLKGYIHKVRLQYHTSKDPANQSHLDVLFGYVFTYYGIVATATHSDKDEKCLLLATVLYELAQSNPHISFLTAKAYCEELQAYWEANIQEENLPLLPATVHYLQLLWVLFPIHDIQHVIVTPTLLFCGQVLSQGRFHTVEEVHTGLLIASGVLEVLGSSKKWMPEVYAFLLNVLHALREGLQYPPLASRQYDASRHAFEPIEGEKKVISSLLSFTLILLQEGASASEDMDFDNVVEIFGTFAGICKRMQGECADALPGSTPLLEEVVKDLLSRVQRAEGSRKVLRDLRKPKAIPSLEPMIDEGYTKMKNYNPNKKAVLGKKDRAFHRREHRKKLQTTRRENIAQQMEQEDRDRELREYRSQKTKELFHLLSNEQHEWREEQRRKKMIEKNKLQ